MPVSSRIIASLLAAVGVATASAAVAAPILTLPGLTAVRVYEVTTATNAYDFAPGAPTLSSPSGVDITTLANSEVYDVFVSDAAGSLDPNGAFVTITGRCDHNANAGCFNIAAVSLLGSGALFGSGELFADQLTRAVYGHAPVPGSAALAVDGLLSTFTTLGDTTVTASDPGPFPDMAITVGFAGVSPTAVPEPGGWALMIAGFAAVAATLRARRALAA